jgi:mannose-6-phosphate isomerase
MTELYPLLMTPLFDPRPWGRLDLSPIYSQHFHFNEKIGESWLTGDNCKVQNGAHAGKSLAELASRYRRELVGNAPRDIGRFPLLMKFLFPQEKLSVQVHPDDAAAREIGQPCGKTECWYVAYAEPGAEIGLGLRKGATRAEFERSIHENRAEELLNWIKVSAGDMIYVAGGTVHTLGPGSIIVETQQQSDTTFRLYDYGRPRELHLKDGLRVIKEHVSSGKVRPRPFSQLDGNGNRLRPLVASEYFAVEQFALSSDQAFPELAGKSSAQILAAIDGQGALVAEGFDAVEFAKGDAVVVPATIQRFRIEPRREIQFLRSYVPGVAVGDPETIIS